MQRLGNILLVVCLFACGSVGSEKPETNCISESDLELCSQIGNACESHTITDKCGEQRIVDCGQCADGLGCVVGSCKVPVCTTFNYTSVPIPAFSRSGIQDELVGATPDGRVIIYLQGASPCGSPHVVIADETATGSGVFTFRDVTVMFGNLGLYIEQKGYAITADGLEIIALSTDRKRLLSTRRSSTSMIDFTPISTTDFDQINKQINGVSATFIAPVISYDRLELIYTIIEGNDSINGTYSSVRLATSGVFPMATKIAAATPYPAATGISIDRLTLFVFDAFNGRILTRKSTSTPFINSNAPAPPPLLSNWYHIPLADCSKLIAVASPGGCQNEDVVLMTRN